MKTKMKSTLAIILCAAAIVAGVGCNSPTGLAVQMVGKAVDVVETDSLGNELLGKPTSAADAKFGKPLDVYSRIGGARKWHIYSGSLDIVGNQRYVVESRRDNIIAVAKVKLDPTGVDLARKFLLDQKAEGKTPEECEAALDLGRPLLTVRSDMTGLMAQLYDARTIPGIGSPKYCRLKFDANQKCNEVSLVDVEANAGNEPPG